MRGSPLVRSLLLVALGALVGSAVAVRWSRAAPGAAGQTRAAEGVVPASSAESDLAHLKDVVPSQSHSMSDVGYHFANLWFAGRQRNWPLATFYFNETRSHIRWTIRIRPVRKHPADGHLVELQGIFDGIENGVLNLLKAAIDAHDPTQFEAMYRTTLESCYSCHKSSGLPHLRPMIPQAPGQPIINPDPNATWPQ
ncbi:MAG: hypothetical protein HY824_10025 [Acidobacteria bacterium]|nr:hypothetical protein [Acidobacteriota bacterium]